MSTALVGPLPTIRFQDGTQCTGCQIARSEYLRSMWVQEQDGVPIHRPADWQAPR
ncbi:MAG: hypothetical protein ACRDRX_04565 [Pseudonocardiaceae bacterium]